MGAFDLHQLPNIYRTFWRNSLVLGICGAVKNSWVVVPSYTLVTAELVRVAVMVFGVMVAATVLLVTPLSV